VDVVFQPEIEGLNDKMVVDLQEGKLSRIRLIISIFCEEIIKKINVFLIISLLVSAFSAFNNSPEMGLLNLDFKDYPERRNNNKPDNRYQ